MHSPDSSERASWWQWLLVALLVGNLSWTTLCLGGYWPGTMVASSALNGLLLLVHFLGRACQTRTATRLHPAGWLLLPFLIYAAANAAWITPVPWLGWHDWLLWAQMIAVFWVVLNDVRAPAARATLLGTLFCLGAVSVILAGYQYFMKPDWLMLGWTQTQYLVGRASGPFRNPNNLAALLLLILPAAGALAVKRGVGGGWRFLFCALTLILGGGLLLTISRGAWLALALALAIWPLFGSNRRWRWRLGAVVLIAGAVLGMVATLYCTVPQVRARLHALVNDTGERSRPIMWRGAWQIFREQPGVGGGAGSFKILFEKYRPENFQDEVQWAHNEYLNTLCDYGLAGFGLFFGACGAIALRSMRGTPPLRSPAGPVLDNEGIGPALAVGGLAFTLQLFVEFHFKIPALGMIFATISALLVQGAWPAAQTPGPNRRLIYMSCGLATMGLLVNLALPHYRGEAARDGMRRTIDRIAAEPVKPADLQEMYGRARGQFQRATEMDPSNSQAWSDRAYATELWSIQEESRIGELGREAEGYARTALSGSKSVVEFWLRLGVALDMQGRWVEAGDAFTEALRRAPANATPWFYCAYHFSLKPTTRLLAVAAIATSLRLDDRNREAEALSQRLAAGR